MQGKRVFRIAMGVEYDGSAFHGWQIQRGVRTVQQEIESAISRVADHAVRVHCAGRTDSGVHAMEQVIHFDTRAVRKSRSWVLGSNVNLPADVSVCWAKAVADGFHARFSATARHYRYLVLCRPVRSALQRKRAVWAHHQPLDLQAMQHAARDLVGTHDFSSFRALGCQAKSPVREVYYCVLSPGEDLVELRVGANGFLHHMVRNIVGVLLAIGRGDAPVSWVKELLEVCDRTLGGVTAPPHGLYFLRADYPSDFGLPQRHLASPPLESAPRP
jgi:tRNA pseudouridine38-40 synthase